MAIPKEKLKHKFTYADYYSWNDGKRWELIDGVAYNMSPAPLRIHQEISTELVRQISNYLKEKKCKVYAAPFDVRLTENKGAKDFEIENVVQPDISVICDKDKLDDRGCLGAPDLIIEIISPYTAKKDLKEKFEIYEKHVVKEYWIVYPVEKILSIYYLQKNGKYGQANIFGNEDKAPVKLKNFKKFKIDLKDVFTE